MWVLMSVDVFSDVRAVGTIRLWNEAIHASPVEMETDPNIHRHLNDGGVVIIHCETDG